MNLTQDSQIFNSQKLKIYYQEFFPFDSIYKWLSRNNSFFV